MARGAYDNIEAAGTPLPFPVPTIVCSSLTKCYVSSYDSNGRERIVEKDVLITTSHSYEFGRKLGDAIYGEVRHGFTLKQNSDGLYHRVDPKKEVAIKIFSKAKMKQMENSSEERPLDELSAMQILGGHPNIVSPIEYAEDAHFLYAIMEFCAGGELFDFIGKDELTNELIKVFFKQVITGLQHVHKNGMALRDLSLENVLVSSSGVCKIIDFGMTLHLPRNPISGEVLKVKPLRACGKQNYISPEALSNSSYFNPQISDIWCAGAMLFIMLTGCPAYETANQMDPRFKFLVSGKVDVILNHWNKKVDPEAIDLMNKIFKASPDDRLTLEGILSHAWLKDVPS